MTRRLQRTAMVATATTVMAATTAMLSVGAPALAVTDNYLPKVLLGAKVAPQKKLGEFKDNGKLQAGTVQISNSTKGGLVITGKSKAGAPWKVQRPWAELGGELYECDFQGNGGKDLLLMTGVNTTGTGAYSQLLVMLMDKDGVPNNYELVGYFNVTDDEKMLQDVVKVGNVGPLLMRQEIIWGPNSKNYWRNEVYRAVNNKLEAWKTSIGGVAFPAYVPFTRKPNHTVAPNSAALETQTKKDHTGAKRVPLSK